MQPIEVWVSDEINVAAGTAFEVLQCAFEHRDEVKLPLDACVVGLHVGNSLFDAVWSENMWNFVPQRTFGGD